MSFDCFLCSVFRYCLYLSVYCFDCMMICSCVLMFLVVFFDFCFGVMILFLCVVFLRVF